jgi:hypothetical protein
MTDLTMSELEWKLRIYSPRFTSAVWTKWDRWTQDGIIQRAADINASAPEIQRRLVERRSNVLHATL